MNKKKAEEKRKKQEEEELKLAIKRMEEENKWKDKVDVGEQKRIEILMKKWQEAEQVRL